MEIKTLEDVFEMWLKYVSSGCNVAFGNFIDCLKNKYVIY